MKLFLKTLKTPTKYAIVSLLALCGVFLFIFLVGSIVNTFNIWWPALMRILSMNGNLWVSITGGYCSITVGAWAVWVISSLQKAPNDRMEKNLVGVVFVSVLLWLLFSIAAFHCFASLSDLSIYSRIGVWLLASPLLVFSCIMAGLTTKT